MATEGLPNADEGERAGFGRYVSHTAIGQVCKWVCGSTPPHHVEAVVHRLRLNPRLSSVATSFMALQEQREAADYDHGAEFNRTETIALVRRARDAVRRDPGSR